MIIDKTQKYIFTSPCQAAKWNKIHNTDYHVGDFVLAPIEDLKTKRDFRRRQIRFECDCCHKIFTKRLDALANQQKHYCVHCACAGERNYWSTHTVSEETRRKLSLATSGERNGFYGKTHSKEHCEKRRRLMLGNKCHLGCKNTPEQLKRISDAVNKGYRDGTRARTHGNSNKGNYKQFIYQSSYELNFLQHMDQLSLLQHVERGPTIQYIGLDGKQHSYLSDYIVVPLNLVVEIKSTHFLELDYDTNMLKFNAAKQSSYDFILVLDNNFEELDAYFSQSKQSLK